MSSKLKGDLAPNKTPYELRLEILHLAQHIVEEKAEKSLALIHAKSDFARALIDSDSDEGEVINNEIITSLDVPNMGVDEVLTIARKLNNFVSNG
tara:strand:+ start:805 stop:1089 length:285 start_codon:yes stop_codon:yes gene_type:complete